ncbi:hypothetical protein SBADM41S_09415 [Streptomyces badius]
MPGAASRSPPASALPGSRTDGSAGPAVRGMAPISAAMCRARPPGVWWSKATVADRRSPVAALRPLRSSTAVSESKPDSRKWRSGSIVSLSPYPRSAPACSRTSSSIALSSCSAVSPARRLRSASVSETVVREAARRTGATSERNTCGTPQRGE